MSKCSASVGSKKYVSYNTGIFTRKPKRDHPAPQLIFRPIKRPLRTELPAFRNIPPHPAAGKAEAIYSTYPASHSSGHLPFRTGSTRTIPAGGGQFSSLDIVRSRFMLPPDGKHRTASDTLSAPAQEGVFFCIRPVLTRLHVQHLFCRSASRTVFLHQARLDSYSISSIFSTRRCQSVFDSAPACK